MGPDYVGLALQSSGKLEDRPLWVIYQHRFCKDFHLLKAASSFGNVHAELCLRQVRALHLDYSWNCFGLARHYSGSTRCLSSHNKDKVWKRFNSLTLGCWQRNIATDKWQCFTSYHCCQSHSNPLWPFDYWKRIIFFLILDVNER